MVAVMLLFVLLLGLSTAPPVAAQELPFRTDYQSVESGCPAWEPPVRTGERMQDAARELSTHANRALVIGDLDAAREHFEQAARLDGRSAELHYGLARVLEQMGRLDAALVAYCRTLALDTVAGDAEAADSGGVVADARLRRDALLDSLRLDVPYIARAVFDRAARSASAGEHAEAAAQFAEAADRAPRWPAAVYNEGVALDKLGRYEAAAGRFARYLELRPEADDAVEVARRIGQLERAGGGQSAGSDAALAMGLVVPGFGQFQSGRSLAGIAVVSAVVGAVATGFLVREADVRCLTTPEPGASCPQENIVSRRVTKPYLTPALVAAGAITALAAVEAMLRGGDSPARPAGLVAADGSDTSLGIPRVSVGPQRSLDVVLLGISLQ